MKYRLLIPSVDQLQDGDEIYCKEQNSWLPSCQTYGQLIDVRFLFRRLDDGQGDHLLLDFEDISMDGDESYVPQSTWKPVQFSHVKCKNSVIRRKRNANHVKLCVYWDTGASSKVYTSMETATAAAQENAKIRDKVIYIGEIKTVKFVYLDVAEQFVDEKPVEQN